MGHGFPLHGSHGFFSQPDPSQGFRLIDEEEPPSGIQYSVPWIDTWLYFSWNNDYNWPPANTWPISKKENPHYYTKLGYDYRGTGTYIVSRQILNFDFSNLPVDTWSKVFFKLYIPRFRGDYASDLTPRIYQSSSYIGTPSDTDFNGYSTGTLVLSSDWVPGIQTDKYTIGNTYTIELNGSETISYGNTYTFFVVEDYETSATSAPTRSHWYNLNSAMLIET